MLRPRMYIRLFSARDFGEGFMICDLQTTTYKILVRIYDYCLFEPLGEGFMIYNL